MKQQAKEEITGELNAKYWVQKSDPLLAMKSVPFTLGELKILDTYISRINAGDDSRRTVIFTKEEYEQLMGLNCANYRALSKHTKALLSRVPQLLMPDGKYMQFVLFEKVFYHKDKYGKPIIELTCTDTAKDIFFCIGKYHYIKYALENVVKLNRKSSYLLYLYIITNRFRGEWEIDVDELRNDVLDCKEFTSYQEYKFFKRDVFEPAVKEVNEKTDCHFEYAEKKHGRKVTEITFTYKSKDQDQIEGQTSIFDEPPTLETEINYGGELANLLGDAACNNEFTPEQVRVLQDLVIEAVPSTDDLERCHYLIRQVHKMNTYQVRKDRRFNYLCQMIRKDIEED